MPPRHVIAWILIVLLVVVTAVSVFAWLRPTSEVPELDSNNPPAITSEQP